MMTGTYEDDFEDEDDEELCYESEESEDDSDDEAQVGIRILNNNMKYNVGVDSFISLGLHLA